jgi:hypothetical protein
MVGWTMPEGDLLQLVFMRADSTDLGLAVLLVDGTPYDFYFIIDDTLINRIAGQHLCHSEVARWVRHRTTFLTTFMATNYKRTDEKSTGFLAWIGLVHFPTITDYWC